jgi:ComF family protein
MLDDNGTGNMKKGCCSLCEFSLDFDFLYIDKREIHNVLIDGIFSIGEYENLLRQAIIDLKFSKRYRPIEIVWDKFIKEVNDEDFRLFMDSQVIIPVPLHWYRKFTRGFNQAEFIAGLLSDQTGVKMICGNLIRNKRTKEMPGLTRNERYINVKDAFKYIKTDNKYKSAVLVDDVITSGATVSSCAKVLKENGYEKIYVFTISRVSDRRLTF